MSIVEKVKEFDKMSSKYFIPFSIVVFGFSCSRLYNISDFSLFIKSAFRSGHHIRSRPSSGLNIEKVMYDQPTWDISNLEEILFSDEIKMAMAKNFKSVLLEMKLHSMKPGAERKDF